MTRRLLNSLAITIAASAPFSAVADDEPFSLQLLHFADIDGSPEALSHVDALSGLVDYFRDQHANTLLLSSGDNYIPGPRYFAASDDSLADALGEPGNGRGDIALLNAMGVQASAVGNHDLDEGTGAFSGLIGADGDYPGTSFPYLSANLNFSADDSLAPHVVADGQPAESIPNSLAASTTIDVAGQTVGVVGATTPQLASITSTGGIDVMPASGDLDDLAAAIQAEVNALTDTGINKVILLAHMQQIAVEKALATRLTDVDIIVAGGSNTLLADHNDTLRQGDTAADTYPLAFTSASGEPVLVVNVDGDYRYLGRLVVAFDDAGRIRLSSLDPQINGVWASTEAVASQLGAQPNGTVASLSESLRSVLVDRDGNIMGNTTTYLDGRRSEVRTEETNLGNLTADANLWYARGVEDRVAVSIKNGGGIRAPIGQEIIPPGSNDSSDLMFRPPQANSAAGKSTGDISQFDIEGTLRFNNALTLLTVTAAELHDIMEHAVAGTAPGATPGQFPQIGGMRMVFDPTATARSDGDTNRGTDTDGDRIRELVVLDDNGTPTNLSDDSDGDVVVRDGMLQGDPNRTFRIVTLNFLASCVGEDGGDCGDGYPYNGLTDPNRLDLHDADDAAPVFDPGRAEFSPTGREQDALAEYLKVLKVFEQPETAPEDDTRIANTDPAGLD